MMLFLDFFPVQRLSLRVHLVNIHSRKLMPFGALMSHFSRKRRIMQRHALDCVPLVQGVVGSWADGNSPCHPVSAETSPSQRSHLWKPVLTWPEYPPPRIIVPLSTAAVSCEPLSVVGGLSLGLGHRLMVSNLCLSPCCVLVFQDNRCRACGTDESDIYEQTRGAEMHTVFYVR